MLKGGPADGSQIPCVDLYCTRRMVIYRMGEYGEKPIELERPAVYLRDESDQGKHKHVGLDGIERESPSLGYRYERSVTRELAARIEKVRRADADADMSDGASW
jgi:hypothetical protein